jgi:uncharacterized protein (TIGR03435 family)
MQELDDFALLRRYIERDSEEAFAALVTRHVNKVYSVALRYTGNPQQAEEITQAVFVILARKSRHLSKRVILEGWLYETTRLTAVTSIRSEIRRARREQEAQMQTTLNESESDLWTQIAPLLDAALAGLNKKDRHAVVLRFFYGRSMKEIGTALGGSEGTARMRINRAIEKLRKFFKKRGISSTTATIAGAISSNSVQAAPVALAKSVTAVAIAKGVAAGGSTLTLVKGALKIMAWSKAKTAVVTGAIVLLAAGTTTVTVKEIQEHRTYPWQVEGFDDSVLNRQPPQVRILPSKCKYGAYGYLWNTNGEIKLMGTGVSAVEVVLAAYHFHSPTRTILSTELPQGKFDYIACLPKGNEEALRQEIKKQFGLVGHTEMVETNVLLLKVQNFGASGLKQSDENSLNGATTRNDGPGEWSCKNSPLSNLANYLEEFTGVPVIDQTGLTNNFDIDVKWKQTGWDKPNLDGMKQTLLDQLGLELVSANAPIEMLFVEKAQ